MIKNTIAVLSCGLATSGLIACGGQDGPQGNEELSGSLSQPTNAPDARSAIRAERKVVAELDVAGAHVQFVELTAPAGAPLLAVEESAPLSIGAMPVERLLAESEAPLTALEVFRALTNDKQADPEVLLASHAEETAALGRASSDVLRVSFNVDAPLEKTIAACDAWVFPVSRNWSVTNKQSLNNASGDNWLAVGGSWSFRTTSQVSLGLCNDSSSNVTRQISWDVDLDSLGWIYSAEFSSAPGSRWRWFPFTKNQDFPCSDFACFPSPVRYGVRGASSAGQIYHLKTAEVAAVIF